MVALLLADLIGLGACGSVSGAHGALPTPTRALATATPPPVPTVAIPGVPAASPLAWTPAQLPTGPSLAPPNSYTVQGPTIGMVQSDGATAYACAPAPGSSPDAVVTWLTHDRGASWQPAGGITVALDDGSPIEVWRCQIVVDALQANTAVVQVAFGLAGMCTNIDCVLYALYLSTDMGQHWAPLQAPHYPQGSSSRESLLNAIGGLATYQQVTYAVFRSPPRSMDFSPRAAFVMSRDHLRTWTPVPGLTAVPVGDFWLNPVTGALLMMMSGGLSYSQEPFLTSTDGGRTWTDLAEAPFPFAVDDIVVQQPFTDQPWQICGGDPTSHFENGVQQNTHIDTLACTADGGTHWVSYQLDVPNDLGGGADTGANYGLVGIADDGSVLLTTPAGLERIVRGGAAAQALGPVPNGGFPVYAAGDGAGMLWLTPQGYPAGSHAQGRIFTAPYA